MIVQGTNSNGPLCPNSLEPTHDAHRLHTRIVNAAYAAAERGPDDEMPEPVAAVYAAVTYGPVTDRMDLFVETVSALRGGAPVTVETWWFRCRICGLVLPAQVRSACDGRP